MPGYATKDRSYAKTMWLRTLTDINSSLNTEFVSVQERIAILLMIIQLNFTMSSSIFKMGALGWSVLNVSMYICTRSSHLLPPLVPCEVVGQHTTDVYTTFHLKLFLRSKIQHLSSAKCVLFTIHYLRSTC